MSFASLLAAKGAAVVFYKDVPGEYDPATDTQLPPTRLEIPGDAMEIAGDPNTYLQLGLIESENPTLLFRPYTLGQLPTLGMRVDWGGETLTAKNINRLAMNGTPEAAKIVVSR